MKSIDLVAQPALDLPVARTRRGGYLSRGSGSREQLRYLAQSIRLEETPDPRLSRAMIWTLAVVCFGLFAWAGYTTVPEVARAGGQIVPVGFEREVQHPFGGTITSLLVRTGAQVETGQLIARIDAEPIRKDLARLDERARVLGITAERLRAYLEERPADFTPFGTPDRRDVREAEAGLAAMRADYDNRYAVALKQREQRERELAAVRARHGAARTTLAELEELFVRQEALGEKGLVRFGELVRLRRDVGEQRGEMAALGERLMQAEAGLREFETRVASVRTSERSALLQQLADVEGQIADNAARRDKVLAQLRRTDITAPIAGQVKIRDGLGIGSFLSPGESVVQIVPTDTPLVAQVRISPRDIGRVEPGQPVQVRVSAYDFVQFGSIDGTLAELSPGSFSSPDGVAYFTGEIALARDYVGSNPAQRISAGMTIDASIVNGERTLLAYLVKPVKLALAGAFGEH
ncbi:HlyD family secretion protein/adhesin transport system membrane fusion protein [Palleronia aestuarii]|uniref:Membrane fusion protein (MFP) family protein n=1 Tax=Palleronia aestuarii TaxID=568105 RepID=A0A2W7MW71_9RHOB|nr:HlyD family type I secretion periplasmic adaptor subunit [Palleronia aestuarii]PZX11891.1 HlyD family secretion protein/adhesin transport system membrane fusion protein [Palleronia aestuarii]